MSFVYFVRNADTGYVKIGFSKSPRDRLRSLANAAPNLALVATQPGGRGDERELHARFASSRVAGEWFRPDAALTAHIESLPSPADEPRPAYTSAIMLRVPGDLLAQIDAYVDEINARSARVTRTGVMLHLLAEGLRKRTKRQRMRSPRE